MLVRQLPRQPPAHTDVAVVVDDIAEDVAKNRRQATISGWHHNNSPWFTLFVDTNAGKVAECRNGKGNGKLITSRGPGTAMDFALALVERLAGKAKRQQTEAGLVR